MRANGIYGNIDSPIAFANDNCQHGNACIPTAGAPRWPLLHPSTPTYMSEPVTTPVSVGAPPPVVSLLEPAAVLAAMSDPGRYDVVRTLTANGPMSVKGLAAKLQRPADGISKHLRVLRDARMV